MQINISPETLDTILEGLLFSCSCDITGNSDSEYSEKLLGTAEELVEKTGGKNSPAFSTKTENIELYDNFEGKPVVLEQPELADRIRKILRI